MKTVVSNSGDLDATVVYLYEGQKIIETRDGSGNLYQQFIHGTQPLTFRNRCAINSGPHPSVMSRRALVMVRVKDKGDLYVHQGERSERERAATGKVSREACVRPAICPQGASTMRATGGANWNVILDTTHSAWRRRRGSDPSGACRALDLDFDSDVDDADLGLFDSLPQGLSRHPGRLATNVHQPFAHQGLLHEPEVGSYQNRRRRYAPAIGRFLQRDPHALDHDVFSTMTHYIDGLNEYEYVFNNPIALSAPEGYHGFHGAMGMGWCAAYLACLQQNPDDGYAHNALHMCNSFGDSAWANCVRQCLVINYECGDGWISGTLNHAGCYVACVTPTGQCQFDDQPPDPDYWGVEIP